MTYNYIVLPYLTYRDTTGNALTGGYLYSYNNTTGDPAPFYQDAEGTTPYTNPLYFENIGQLPPLYADSTVETYRVEFYDSSDALIQSFTLTPPSTSGSSTSTVTPNNLILNGQFRFFNDSEVSPAPSDETLIADDAFYFKKDGSGATDSVSFNKFSLDADEPESTPIYYLEYECTVAGTGETYKDLVYKIKDVRSLQGLECTFSLAAATLNNETVSISFYVQQYFGTGGSPSSTITTLISAFSLTTTQTTYSSIFTVPALSGVAVGNNGDDSLNLIIRFPLNQTCDIAITNLYLQEGANSDVIYPFETYAETQAMLQATGLPDATASDHNKAVVYQTTGYNESGSYTLTDVVPIGALQMYLGTSNPSNGWYLCNGQQVPKSGYFQSYYDLVGYNYTLLSGVSVSVSSHTVTITCDEVGSVTAPAVFNTSTSTNVGVISGFTNGTSTTRATFNFVVNTTPSFSGYYNTVYGFYFYTPDGKKHGVAIEYNSFPIAASLSSFSLDSFIICSTASTTGTTVASNIGTYLALNSPNGMKTSDNLFATASGNIVTVYNSLSGAPLNQPDSGTVPFTLTVVTVGSTGVYQNYTITTTAAGDISYGEYFICSTLTYDLCFYFIIDDTGSKPDGVTADYYIPILINSVDTDDEVATAIANAMNGVMINVPDFRGLFARGVSGNYFWGYDGGTRFAQGSGTMTSSSPGSLEMGNYDNTGSGASNNYINYLPVVTDDTNTHYPVGSWFDPRARNFAINYIVKVY